MSDFDFDQFLEDTRKNELSDLEKATSKKVDTREKFPCEHCMGTGRYRGVRLHQDKSHCFACKGKGYFYQSKFDRDKAKASRQQSKARKLEDARAAFDERNPGLALFLASAASWSSFAASLYGNIQQYGSLTDKQEAAAISMRAKSAARDVERNAARAIQQQEREASVAAVQAAPPMFSRMAEGFLSAGQHLKFPKLELQTEDGLPVVLTRCGMKSKTPGHISITDGGDYGSNKYYGRLDPEGRAFMRNDAPASVTAVLIEFNANPQEAVKVQGKRTGNCCCCGRTLTNPASIEAGIGPICAGRWGF